MLYAPYHIIHTESGFDSGFFQNFKSGSVNVSGSGFAPRRS